MSYLTDALQIEVEGEQYYQKQAELVKGSALQQAFLILANAENQHARLLRSLLAGDDSPWVSDLLSASPVPLFADKTDFMRSAEVMPGQLEVYAVALEMEQKSIDLYQNMLAETKDEKARLSLQYLLGQEHDHYALFDELTALLRRPRDWVEDAEFGNRPEY